MNTPSQIFVVTLTKHRIFGYLLYPFWAEQITGEPFLRIIRKIRQHDLNDPAAGFTGEMVRLIKLAERYSDEKLARKFCPDKPASELPNLVRRENIKQKLLTYIEGTLAEVLDLLKNSHLPVYLKKEKYSNLYAEDLLSMSYRDTGAVLHFDRLAEEIRYHLTLREGERHISLLKKNVEVLVTEPCRIFYQNKIYFFDDISASKLLPFREKEYISIPKKMEERYFETFILGAVKCQEVQFSGFEIREMPPVKEAILSLETDLSGRPVFVLFFTYNGHRLRLQEGERKAVTLKKIGDDYLFETFSREVEWENEKLAFLAQMGLNGPAEGLRCKATSDEPESIYQAVAWLSEQMENLAHIGISISQASLAQPYYLGKHDLKIGIEKKIDWFDLSMTVQIGEWSIPFIRFKRLILNGLREYKLPNGEIFILPEAWFARFGEVLAFAKAETHKLVLQPYHFMLLSESIAAGNPEMAERIRALGSHNLEPQEIPGRLNAQLRNYQLEGFNWLYHLWKNGLNGCLADDMGLGKTLQTLVLLLKLQRKEEEANAFFFSDSGGQLSLFGDNNQPVKTFQPASLIVLPVSLLHNWAGEIKKFAPSLKVYTYSGVKRKEKMDLGHLIRYYDVILTTYGTVRNDHEALARHTFFYLILDESQNIKNAESKSYRAVASIPSRHRLSLTGTPIENSLSDLWSQLNFLNPGHLGSFKFFKERYLLPIEKEHDAAQTASLNRLIQPFVLRRTKEQVAADLPPVMEESLIIEMTPEQLEFYESEKSSVRNYLLQNMEEMEPRKTTFVVLQALTRLRQIAIHPRMIDPASAAESGKFNEMLSMLEVLVAENHKILVFSSFVKHLNLLGDACDQMKWGYCRLTGQTTDRKSVIEEFQSGNDKNIFLISLKAGGVGLNLTAADYIFIVDPWWNPAAEMQAISRAHRIGQDKKVFVYRFISEKSIEEKIQLLQEKKAALANEFVNSNDPFAVMGKEELIQLFS